MLCSQWKEGCRLKALKKFKQYSNVHYHFQCIREEMHKFSFRIRIHSSLISAGCERRLYSSVSLVHDGISFDLGTFRIHCKQPNSSDMLSSLFYARTMLTYDITALLIRSQIKVVQRGLGLLIIARVVEIDWENVKFRSTCLLLRRTTIL